jgi:hypothetical protein
LTLGIKRYYREWISISVLLSPHSHLRAVVAGDSLVPGESTRKEEFLNGELLHYYTETCPILAGLWEAALRGQPPHVIRELWRRLEELDEITKAANQQIRESLQPALQAGASTEPALDQALASFERVQELADSIIQHLAELEASKR